MKRDHSIPDYRKLLIGDASGDNRKAGYMLQHAGMINHDNTDVVFPLDNLCYQLKCKYGIFKE